MPCKLKLPLIRTETFILSRHLPDRWECTYCDPLFVQRCWPLHCFLPRELVHNSRVSSPESPVVCHEHRSDNQHRARQPIGVRIMRTSKSPYQLRNRDNVSEDAFRIGAVVTALHHGEKQFRGIVLNDEATVEKANERNRVLLIREPDRNSSDSTEWCHSGRWQ